MNRKRRSIWLFGFFFLLIGLPLSTNPAYAVSGTYNAGSGSTSNFSPYYNFVAGEILTAVTYSRSGDPYLYFLNSSGVVVASDDDSAGDLNSRIIYTIPSSGQYRFRNGCYNNGSCSYSVNYSTTSPAPSISSVNSSTANGTYTVGSTISIQINFSEAVNVTGTPTLTLETGNTDRSINYTSGSGSATLNFSYTVQTSDTSGDLDYVATSSLALNGGTINSSAGNAANLTLPSPGAANSLSANKSIVIDTTGPSVNSVTSSTTNGSFNAAGTISIQIVFSENVVITGTPQLTLETGATDRILNYVSLSANTATFTYTVQAGDTSNDLDYVSTAALSLNAGTIRDSVGNNATLTLPAPGSANSLGANKSIIIDTTAPAISTVTAPSNATYKPADTPTFTVAFSESVTVTGTPRLTLTVGAITKYANYVSQTDSRTALFRYTVASGITEFDTDGISISNTLDLNSGSIADLATNLLTPYTFSAPNTSSILIAQPPAAPIIDSVTAGSGSISLYFRTTTYGSAITNYEYSTNNGVSFLPRSPADTSTVLRISGLANGTSYQVRIRALSAAGTSDSSTSITARPNAISVAGGSNITTTYGTESSTATFTSTGGVGPYVYTLASAVPGVSILNGVVTASSTLAAGTYSLTVISTDSFLAFETRTVTINVSKAAQDRLAISSAAGVFQNTPSVMQLLHVGGSDTGAVTYSIASGGSASGCSISGSQLSVNSAGTCNLVATKAATSNYLIAYSDTATVTFTQYISYQPVQTQSVPTQLPITGKNDLDLTQTLTVPAVTGVFLVGSTYEINGTGFTGVNRVVIGGAEAIISSSTSTKIVISSADLMPGPLFIECSDGRIGPSPFYFFTP